MKFLILLMTICFTAIVTLRGDNITIIENRKTDYSIVIPDNDPGNRIRRGANLLQKLLKESTGAEIPILNESSHKKEKPAFYLGNTSAAKAAEIPIDSLKAWTYLKRVAGNDIFLAGSDAQVLSSDPNYAYKGTLKAVTSFLEDEVGVRFLLPGPNGLYVPKLSKLNVNKTLNSQKTPSFSYCSQRPLGEVYDIANNYFRKLKYRAYGGHSYYHAVPKKKYAKSHPEYFALRAGERDSSMNHLCISHPEVQKLMIKLMEKEFDKGYEWVQLAQTDGYQPCECDMCSALDDDPAEALWKVHVKLAKEMNKRRPGKKVVILSYNPTWHPPKTIKKLPRNVMIELCHYEERDFKEWGKYTSGFLVYLYNWGYYHVLGFTPKRTPHFAGEQIKSFVRNKVKGVYKAGFGELLGLEGPVYYVFGKMIQNPSLFASTILEDFYQKAYGKAYAPMKAFFEKMYERLELYTHVGKFGKRKDPKSPFMPLIPEDFISYFYPPKLILSMEKNLNRARELVEDRRVKARIRLVEREFGYLKNLSSIFYFYHAYRLNPNWVTFNILGKEIEKRNTLIDSWYDKTGKMKVEDGWPKFFANAKKKVVKSGGLLSGILSSPFNWNIKLLREKKILPGTGKKSLKISRLEGKIKLDGRLDEKSWRSRKNEELNEIGMGSLKEHSRFKAAYDDEYLYFGIECDFALIEKLKLKPVGKDGGVYNHECIEIFIDPFGERQKSFHIMFNPIPNSTYDERFGFATDPVDPNFGKWVKGWNGEWNYASYIDNAGKRWTAEVRVPYSTLGVSPPQSGDIWSMNIGRAHRDLNEGKHSKPELSLWSPNLEARSFKTLDTYGDLIFR